jgi:polyether ionophore transport system permease protein
VGWKGRREIMLRSIWGKTLRDYRAAVLGWGAGLALFMGLTLAYVASISQATRDAAAEYAKAIPLLADAIAVETPTGYATWHSASWLPVILGIWTILAGARLVRGEEERGALDVLLTSPYERTRVLLEKLAALALAILLIALLIGLGCVVGEALGGIEVNVAGSLLAGLNAGLAGMVFGMVALLLSQLFTRRVAAAGWAAGLMAFSYLLNTAGRMVEGLSWLRYLSPLYYHDLNKPLIVTYRASPVAYLILLALSVALAGASVALFAGRDIGGTALAAAHSHLSKALALAVRAEKPMGLRAWDEVEHDLFERSTGLRALRAEMGMVVWWIVGVGVLIVWVTSLARTAKDLIARMLETTPALKLLLGQFNATTDAGYISSFAFLYLPILFVLFAMTIAITWAHDVESGRMELALATPLTRRRAFSERFGAVALGAVALTIASGLVMLVSAWAVGLQVDLGRLTLAFVGLLPLELLTVAAVFALAGWLRASLVIAIVGALVGISYFADLLSALLKLPNWVVSLSIFHQYGAPLVEDPRWLSWLALLALAAGLVALGGYRFTRQDIHQGS